ncbi:hypothetical protein CY34DRAFT_808862 [Suillus luteus UH-Slu-Lm8-n1]|uniref:DUF6533 domain-containing protein n=1 Tax=Suillus luteus UH-Slu-Lm8-n1 TaxID=930992 RepID=A0A0D0B501_9AGAM|nr:hypothetical protein CY34DRAFT_808862 [Suillus luteus UH-Slu-Lm8-n1]
MTTISNDPAWWGLINWDRVHSYFVVSSYTVVVYEWVLTFSQEVELVWRQRWSLMTALYIGVRYIGISSMVANVLSTIMAVSMTDAHCTILWFVQVWTPVVVNAMLGVIIMARVLAMYQRSKQMLVLLGVVLMACTIASGVMVVIANTNASGKEFIRSGNHQCVVFYHRGRMALNNETLIPTFVWETFALCLALRIAIKHFCELRQTSTGSMFGNWFIVLIQTHVLYFVAFVAVSCFSFGSLSPNIIYSTSMGDTAYFGILQIVQPIQMFVLGPRLILSIREYHTERVASSDEPIAMRADVFRGRRHVSTNFTSV